MGGAVVGPLGGYQPSKYLDGDSHVVYNSWNPRQGLAILDALIRDYRATCPGDHIKLLGHSAGAGIIHAWVSANSGFGRVNAILLADPKRAAGPGSAGLASIPGNGLIGYPLAGVDANFGDIPVLSICQHDDVVCNVRAGWFGYLTGAHMRYDGDADSYGTDWSGVWFL
jgi:cutinase